MNEDNTSHTPVKTRSGPLTPDEQDRLAELEPIIEQGLKDFVDVGNALLEISDERLYRETHSTFKQYVEEKWKLQVRQAYRLCEAAEVVKDLPAECVQLVTNEGQARELAKVVPEKRAKVLKVASGNGPVTAKAIRDAADDDESPRVVAHTEVMPHQTGTRMADTLHPPCGTERKLTHWYWITNPARRGNFVIHQIFQSSKPVKVPSKDKLRQAMEFWFSQVKEGES